MKPTWDQYFIDMLPLIAARGTCDRAKGGAIVTLGNRIISTGYNGAPSGAPSCDQVGHLKEFRVASEDAIVDTEYCYSTAGKGPFPIKSSKASVHCTRTIHAEVNAIIHARTDLTGATLYCSMTPCRDCAKLIIAAGIKRVVAADDYHASGQTKSMFVESGVKLEFKDER